MISSKMSQFFSKFPDIFLKTVKKKLKKIVLGYKKTNFGKRGWWYAYMSWILVLTLLTCLLESKDDEEVPQIMDK